MSQFTLCFPNDLNREQKKDTTRPNLTSEPFNKVGKVITVATFDPTPPQSQLPEGLAIDKEGNIYVGMYPTGQIWKITTNGEQSILATCGVSSNPAKYGLSNTASMKS